MTRDGTTGATLRIDLFDSGMTALHRVGLAGLSMTLRALEGEGEAAELREIGDWQTDERSVSLEWRGDGKTFFQRLLAASFRLTESGLIWFPALGHPLDCPGQSALLHNAMLGTFLQHTKARGTGKQPGSIAVEVDEATYAERFLPLEWYMHQRVKFDPSRPMQVAGWLYPGGVVRHVSATAQTALWENAPQALALIYAPIGAIYFQVHRRTARVRPQYCLALPSVVDLEFYAGVRALFLRQGVARLHVSGAADAAVRVLAELEAHNLVNTLAPHGCSVMAFGTVPWSKQQKTRIQRFSVAGPGREGLRAYRAASQLLPPQLTSSKPDPKSGEVRRWWTVPHVPDLVAHNVIKKVPWWDGFADLWGEMRQGAEPAQRDWVLWPEKEGLKLMAGNESLLAGPEAQLVRACQEAWRRRLGALGERARDHGLNFSDLSSREYERMRTSFVRCKSPSMLRQTLVDFWSRAGSLPELQEHWPEILPMLSARWRESRDLALLALASYKGEGDYETRAATVPAEKGGVQ